MTNTNTTIAPLPRRETHSASSKPRKRLNLRQGGESIALVLIIVTFTVINPHSFPTVVNLQTILDQASTPLIVGVGATLVILLGCIDLSVEGLMSACGLAFVLLAANSRTSADLGVWAIVVGVLLGALLGLANGLIHALLKIPSFIVTLGMGFVGFGIATLLFGDKQLPFLANGDLKNWPTDKFLGLTHSFWLAAAVVATGMVVARYTRLGRFTCTVTTPR